MKKAKNIFLVFLLAIVFNFVFVSKPVLASSTAWTNQRGMADISSAFGQAKDPGDIRYTITSIINLVLEFLGIICIILIIFAGFKWMTSGGSEEQVTSAKKILKNAIIGLIIILLAWSITLFIILRMEAIVKNDSLYLNPVNIH